jgi:hypothetical protein
MSWFPQKKFRRTNEMSGETFGSELAALALSNGVVINCDRSLGYGFRIDAPYTPTLPDEAVRSIYERLAGFCNALPEHFDLQLIWTQHSRRAELEARLKLTDYSAGLTGEVQREQQENLLAMLAENRLRWIEVYFILVRKLRPAETASTGADDARSVLKRLSTYFAGAAASFQYSLEQYEAASAELLIQARTLASTLAALGWSPAALDDEQVRRLFFQRWNPRQFALGSNPRSSGARNGLPFTEQYAQSAFRWDPTGGTLPAGMAELDGWYHAILTLYEPPENLARPVFDEFLLLGGLPQVELVINAERGDRQQRLKRLKTLLRQRQNDPQTSTDPAERAATLQLTEELEEMGSQSEGTWRAACYLHLWADSTAVLRERIASALALARSYDAVFIREQNALWPYWRAMQPFWTQDKDRYRLLDYSTRQLVRLLPCFGQPTNLAADKAVGVLYQTASRSLFNWIVPDETLFGNPHHLIIGGTGSGKSVLQDENLIAMRRRGAKAIIIDLGGSFSNFCAASGGVYIDYDIKSRANRLNPLWLPPGVAPDPEVLRSRALWLEALVTERGRRLSGDELIVLENALRRAYFRDLFQPVYLRQVRAALLRDEAGTALAHRLSLWCEDGSFANLFDGPSQIDLSASVLVFDLKRVVSDQRDADLGRVIFNSIVGAVSTLALAGSAEPKFLTFDEAGMMLKDEATAEFMEYCFRTLRKTGVAVGAISQGLEDFLINPRARNAFVGAADNLFVLRQDNFDKARIVAQEKNLGPEELRRIQALITMPGSHAEFLLIQKTPFGQRSLHLLSASTPLKYAFTANSPEDRRIMTSYQAEGLSRADAIRRFAREHPNGIVSSQLITRSLGAAAAAILAILMVGAGLSGCSSAAPNGQSLHEDPEAARREERLRLMQRIWAEETAAPLPGEAARAAPLVPGNPGPVTYPAGSYDGVQLGAHTGLQAGIKEPVR